MLKRPIAGHVKTRLGQDIGMTTAAWWFRHQSQSLLRRLQDPRWELTLAVAPDREAASKRIWPCTLPRCPQGKGDLGDRMGRLLRRGQGPTLIIGADIPGITRSHIARAIKALGSHDAVFGPATDGGYWLIGLKRQRAVPPGLFDNTRWSSSFALQDTIATLPDHRIAFVDTLRDVDRLADLQALTHPPEEPAQSR